MNTRENLSKILLLLCDLFLIYISLFLAVFILNLNNIHYYIPEEEIDERIWIHLSISLIAVGWFWIRLRHYTYRKPFWFELKEIFRTLAIIAIIELAIIAFSKLYSSRYLWLLTWLIAFLIVPLGRIFLKKFLIKTKFFLKDTIIIGTGSNALDAYKALSSEKYLGLNIIQFVCESSLIDEIKLLSIPVIDKNDPNLWSTFSKSPKQIMIALENGESESRDHWLRELTKRGHRSISIIPTLRGLPLYSTDMSFLFSYEVMLLRVNNNLAKRSSRILKRTMDIVGSILIITLLSPVLLALYFMVKKDGGNAVYSHPRIGRNGKTFKCLKFRSMVVNSKEVLEELLATDPDARAEWEKDFKLKNDPRITKIGAFIRKTSLDELPQLLNVLKGEMSLVGPRPIVKEELDRYNEDVDYYLMAKPGMTGLWQVSGRNDVDYDTRVYFDSWYVKNWSLWNDIAILFKTVNVVLNRSGAY